jgi:hypothetical protein
MSAAASVGDSLEKAEKEIKKLVGEIIWK